MENIQFEIKRKPVEPSQKIPAIDLLSSTRSLQRLVQMISRVAASDVSVLIIGESGTGKELAARALHEQSLRSQMPFISLNLAAVPIELAEAVLFGHEKGAFTGACHSSLGYCRKADKGTLFLDEIGEADLPLQSKLLRFLQNREIQPVGSDEIVTTDVRIVAATNRDLGRAVLDKQFREDLFYRLNVVTLKLPPLRERMADLDSLTDFFLDEFNSKYGRQCKISDSVRERFRTARWPGNVRQLRSGIESLVVLSEHNTIGIHDVSSDFLTQIGIQISQIIEAPPAAIIPELERMTHHLVDTVLEQSDGNVSEAAKRLGISKATLYRWRKKYRDSDGS